VIFIEFSFDPILANITIDGFSNANGIEVVNQQGGSTGVDVINAKIGTKCSDSPFDSASFKFAYDDIFVLKKKKK